MRPISLRPISPVAVLVLLVLAGCQQQAGTSPDGATGKKAARNQPAGSPQTPGEGQTLKEITLAVTGMT